MNYGILFTAWGVGGFVLSRLQQMLTAASGGSYASSFVTAGALLIIGALLALTIKPLRAPAQKRRPHLACGNPATHV